MITQALSEEKMLLAKKRKVIISTDRSPSRQSGERDRWWGDCSTNPFLCREVFLFPPLGWFWFHPWLVLSSPSKDSESILPIYMEHLLCSRNWASPLLWAGEAMPVLTEHSPARETAGRIGSGSRVMWYVPWCRVWKATDAHKRPWSRAELGWKASQKKSCLSS